MQMEGAFSHSVELRQAMFGITPKALDSVDVVRSKSELIVAVIDPEVLVETQIDQAVVATPAVRVDDRSQARFAANNGL